MGKRAEEKIEVEILGMRINQTLVYRQFPDMNPPVHQKYMNSYSYTFLIQLETKVYYEVLLFEDQYYGNKIGTINTVCLIKPANRLIIQSMTHMPTDIMKIEIPMKIIDEISNKFMIDPTKAKLVFRDGKDKFKSDVIQINCEDKKYHRLYIAFDKFRQRDSELRLRRPVYFIVTKSIANAEYYLPQLIYSDDHSVMIIREVNYIPANIIDDVIIVESKTYRDYRERISKILDNILGEFKPIIICL